MDRRVFILGISSVTALGLNGRLIAQTPDLAIVGHMPPLPDGLKSTDAPAPYIDTRDVGAARPTSAEIEAAYEVLLGAPFDCKPIEVAEYFVAVGAGAYGADWRIFAREWPVRANPVIFHFFTATQTKPEGDTTAWCAAFLNWCILRARAQDRDTIGASPGMYSKTGKPFDPKFFEHTTNSASSGSFRCWTETDKPTRGDVVVFRDIGTDGDTRACRGTGHVTFFQGMAKPGFARVVGGNQTSPGSNGAVTIADMSLSPSGRFLRFVSLK